MFCLVLLCGLLFLCLVAVVMGLAPAFKQSTVYRIKKHTHYFKYCKKLRRRIINVLLITQGYEAKCEEVEPSLLELSVPIPSELSMVSSLCEVSLFFPQFKVQ